MSRSDAVSRLAALSSSITGWSKEACKSWAQQRDATWELPVPDAEGWDQATLESKILQKVANTFQDRQLTIPKSLTIPPDGIRTLRLAGAGKIGAVYGVLRAHPTKVGLTLHLHPQMAGAWIADVLPHESKEGGFYGIAGLRPQPHNEGTLLIDITSNARVLLQGIPYHSLETLLPNWCANCNLSWINSPSSLTECEREDNHYEEQAKSRDSGFFYSTALINSRILRRPALVNTVAVHGIVNTYRGLDGNPKFEWCCGPSESSFRRALRESGLWQPPWPIPQAHQNYPRPDKATVSLRWSATCFWSSPSTPLEVQQKLAKQYHRDSEKGES
ncbi:hypothetical protein [Streptomyces chrestomyceticus]|uniref:hypothetical protein n=1 Tax=Streptomyces chrestomyceticus TaxID=68185 RepID=UPI0033D10180